MASPHPGRGRQVAPTLVIGLGAAAAFVYASWALTLRRSAFADHESKSLAQLESSDRIDAVLLAVCGVLLVAGLAYWLMTRPGAPDVLDISALTALGLALVAAGVGTYLLLTWDTDADRAVYGMYGLGGGFALSAVALLLGLASRRAAPAGDRPRAPGR
jgi:hypothetical protein